ncbi:bifunctional 2-C-methyl-D-erythritol 4-phosphate cytidylyltransferase/2-C-methyl-D-erythritol 2,4-cyclodiphosphate synthase [Camelliibacillus cellulosilyticus]|uniref:Bifunctional enzyme IspD/IspF n=1 Tax=Camelliibacillus cellulosilyticus TaxID=2174486 RepID=A0ABV9GPP3_9BACL
MGYRVVIPAAGSGRRINAGQNKLLLKIGDDPIIIHTLRVFERDENCEGIVLVVKQEEMDDFKRLTATAGITKVKRLVKGGNERQDSVRRGLSTLEGDGLVLIHDGARPFVSESLLKRVVEAAENGSAAIPAMPVKETLKKVADHYIVATIDRRNLWAAQTPQAFRLSVILEAHNKAAEGHIAVTDDAALMEWFDHDVSIVPGEESNIKVTTPDDLELADYFMAKGMAKMGTRIGQGFDVHRFTEGRPLIIGGVTIPYDRGLEGHSDADVLLHAISDALLGAIGAGDIGRHFPDTDPRYKGADSKQLLKEVWSMVKAHGYSLGNIDAVIIAQKPKMAPYIAPMQSVVAELLEVDKESVNIKATTTETLGFTGREEGIAAQAVCLIEKLA